MADVTVPLRESAATDEPALPRGQSFARYLILDKVGQGGVGEVYAAYDPHLDRRIALKILRPSPRHEGMTSSEDDSQWRKLVREAKALAKLNDANVVTVHDVGAYEGRTFLAMELVEGIDLGAWLGRGTASVDEIVKVLLEAGRGLAAAHAAGVIHRDFKPANVLIGESPTGGSLRVKVGDFGLARLHDDGTLARPSVHTREHRLHDDETTIEHSQVVGVPGTPNYMAPELFAGRPADVRSDVYAYCVTLHEALFGERPFTAPTLTALVAAKEEGPREPASRKGVPRSLVRAVLRGLAPRPEDRWPDMPTLLAAIGRRPNRRIGRVLPFAGLVVAGAAAVALARPDASTCSDADRHLEGIGDDDARARVRAAVLASERSFAEATAIDVDAALASWTARWIATHGTVCEASVHGEQSPAALDARMACLHEGRAELAALVDVLATMEAGELERAAVATRGLPAPEPCASVQPRDDADVGTGATELRERLARAKVLLRAGRGEDARTLALEVNAEASAEPRVAVEAAVLAARGLASLGDYDAAERALEDALFEAQALDHPEMQADAALGLSHVLATRTPRFAEALRWASYADAEQRRGELAMEVRSRVLDARGVALHARGDHEAAITAYEGSLAVLASIEADELLVAGPLDNLGSVLRSAGRYGDAIEKHERALEIRERVLGPDHPDVAKTLNNLASSLMEAGRSSEAITVMNRGLAIRERAFGPDHPDVAKTLNNLAGAQYRLGKYVDAESSARRALAIREAVHGVGHQQCASSHGTLGLALQGQGRLDEAEYHHRRTLEIEERELGTDHPRLAAARSNLANALMDAGKLDEAAALYRKAIATTEARDGVDHPDVAIYATNLGNVLERMGKLDLARAQHERALAIRETALGPDHPDLVWTLMGLAGVHLVAERPTVAIPLLERALVIVDRGETEPRLRAGARFELGQALALVGEHERAWALVDEADALYRAAGPGSETALVQIAEWRAEHR